MRLQSQLLHFSSDAKLVACADASAVTVVGLDGSARRVRIAEAQVTAVAAFPTRVWTLDAARRCVQRWDYNGSRVGVATPVSAVPCAGWSVVPTGAPAVLLQARGRSALVEQTEGLCEISVPAIGIAIPISSRLHVLCHDRMVRFGGGMTCRLAEGVTPLSGCVVFDGKALALVVEDKRAARGVVMIAIESGRMQREFELPNGDVRIAAERGIAFVRTAERQLCTVDLRSGQHNRFETPIDMEDLAVDPLAKRIAIRSRDAIQIHVLHALTARARPEVQLAVEHAAASLEPPVPLPLPAPSVEPPARLPPAPSPAAALVPSASGRPHPVRARIAFAPLNVTSARPELAPSKRLVERATVAAAAVASANSSSMPVARGTAQCAAVDAVPRAVQATGGGLEPPVIDLFKVHGFGAPPRRPELGRDQAAALLDAELQWVGLRTLAAIAGGWDSRRIGFANESRHPYEQEVSGILGMNEGHAREHLEAARARLRAHEQVIGDETSRRAATTPLGALAAEFRLSPLAASILLVAAAPALWGEAGRLYGILANDATRALVDELLIQQILADGSAARSAIAHELEPAAPLREYGLIQTGTARQRPYASLSVDPIVLARMRASPVDLGPNAVTTVRSADRALSELLLPAELLIEAMRYLSRKATREHQARIALRGPTGSGRCTLLAALAAKAERDVGIIDASRLPRQIDAFLDAMRTELRRAWLRGLIPCVARLEDSPFSADETCHGLLRDLVRAHPGPVAVRLAPRAKVPFDPGYLLLELNTPNEIQRLQLWCDALAEHGLEIENPPALAARYRVGAGTIRSVVRGVADARAEQAPLAGDVLADIDARMRQTREVMLGEQARRVERLAPWSSLVLPDDMKGSLRELVGRVRHRRTVFDEWGFDEVVATSRGLTALFEGPPGTGKTLVAGAIARELDLDLYRVDVSKVTSKWLGETEKNLGAIFDAAEDGQVILLFDEADSLFAKRSEVKSSNDRFANLEVNYLLQRLDTFDGFAILTTNFGASIDAAFKRRLSFRLTFPFPDEEMRQELWRVHLPKALPTASELDLATLARKYQLSGGYIRNACLRAAFLAAEEGVPLAQAHLERAVASEFAEVGKLSTSGSMQ